jgi:hypothetical protein
LPLFYDVQPKHERGGWSSRTTGHLKLRPELKQYPVLVRCSSGSRPYGAC